MMHHIEVASVLFVDCDHFELPLRTSNIELSSRAESKKESQFCRQLKETVEAEIAADCSNDLLCAIP